MRGFEQQNEGWWVASIGPFRISIWESERFGKATGYEVLTHYMENIWLDDGFDSPEEARDFILEKIGSETRRLLDEIHDAWGKLEGPR